MSLRQAPRFQAYFSHIEGREVMVMSRRDWQQVSQLREGEMTKIDLSTTPIADVARASRIEAAVVRGSLRSLRRLNRALCGICESAQHRESRDKTTRRRIHAFRSYPVPFVGCSVIGFIGHADGRCSD